MQSSCARWQFQLQSLAASLQCHACMAAKQNHFGTQVSVWSGAVIRGDLNSIRVNAFSSIGDRSVLHAARCSCLLTNLLDYYLDALARDHIQSRVGAAHCVGSMLYVLPPNNMDVDELPGARRRGCRRAPSSGGTWSSARAACCAAAKSSTRLSSGTGACTVDLHAG
jgi:hypothetical protein